MRWSDSLLWKKAVEVFLPAAKTADTLSAAIDLANVKGKVGVLLHSAPGTGNADNTLDVTVHELQTDGTTYAAATTPKAWLNGVEQTGLAFTQVTNAAGGKLMLLVFSVRDLKVKSGDNIGGGVGPKIKIDLNLAGTNPSFILSCSVLELEEWPA